MMSSSPISMIFVKYPMKSMTERWLTRPPFGIPVEPDVKMA